MIKPIQRIYRIIYGLSCLKIYLNDFEKICLISTHRVLLPIRCARRDFRSIRSIVPQELVYKRHTASR